MGISSPAELLIDTALSDVEHAEWFPTEVPLPNKSLMPGENRYAACFMQVLKESIELATRRARFADFVRALTNKVSEDPACSLLLRRASSGSVRRYGNYFVEPVKEAGMPEGAVNDGEVAYVPYSVNPKHYGIYFIAPELVRRFGEALSMLCTVMPATIADAAGFWRMYLYHVYVHALTHHVLEDIASLTGRRYPFLDRESEEGLAEYHAYVTGLTHLYQHNPFLTAESMNPLWAPLTLFSPEKKPVLGSRRNIMKAVIYRYRIGVSYPPRISKDAVATVWPLWPAVREATIRGGAAYLSDVVREEIMSRVWVISPITKGGAVTHT